MAVWTCLPRGLEGGEWMWDLVVDTAWIRPGDEYYGYDF
jgi:hypothetical protein